MYTVDQLNKRSAQICQTIEILLVPVDKSDFRQNCTIVFFYIKSSGECSYCTKLT